MIFVRDIHGLLEARIRDELADTRPIINKLKVREALEHCAREFVAETVTAIMDKLNFLCPIVQCKNSTRASYTGGF